MHFLNYDEFVKQRRQERAVAEEREKDLLLSLNGLLEGKQGKLKNLELKCQEFHLFFNNSLINGSMQEVVGQMNSLEGDVIKLEKQIYLLEIVGAIERAKLNIMEILKGNIDNFEGENIKDEEGSIIDELKNLKKIQISQNFTLILEYHAKVMGWAVQNIKNYFSQKLKLQLEGCAWPKMIEPQRWKSDKIRSLLSLLDNFWILSTVCNPNENIYLMAVKVMVEPIKVRFLFHFATERPTNRIDKPEWSLNYLFQMIETHRLFIENCIELEMIENNEENPSFLETFIQCICDIAIDYFKGRISRILNDPFILIHTVEECFAFCQNLNNNNSKNNFQLDQTDAEPSKKLLDFFFKDGNILENWIEAQKTSSLESYNIILDESLSWGEEILDSSETVTLLTRNFVKLIDELIQTLHLVSDDFAKVEFLSKVIIPIFNNFYQKLEFDIPAFHDTLEDVKILILQANSLNNILETIQFKWGETLDTMILASSEEFKKRFSYDASELPGTIFNKVWTALRELLTKVEDHLYSVLWKSFHTFANHFARSMHYGIARDQKLSMNDDLRRAIINLSDSYNSMTKFLSEKSMDIMNAKLVDSISTFFFEKVILQNYFHDAGIEQFSSDLNQVTSFLSKLMPDQPIMGTFEKVFEAKKILSAPTEMKKKLKSEDVEEVIDQLNILGISMISVSECDKILELYRQ